MKQIKNIAIYLRKSRDEEGTDVLLHHRQKLVEYADKKGWNYNNRIFEEVVSGERISKRVQVQKVLDIVEQGYVDGVLVVHYDRLSRGNSKDFGEIIETFQSSNTHIITPEKIYDVNDENDLTMLEFQGVMSSVEYRRINFRLKDGKFMGAKSGKLTNGRPPFPYETIRDIVTDEKGRKRIKTDVVLNQEKAEIYNRMKEMYLSGKFGTQAIAEWLNNQGIISPNGSTWHNNAVKRTLVHEFHMGIVMYGRNEWKKGRDGNIKEVIPRDPSQVARGVGTHKQLKTRDEHEKLLQILSKNNKIPKRSRQGTFLTSGILYCSKCGHRMSYSIGNIEKKTGKKYDYTKCSYKDPYGNKCSQVGVKMTEEFYNAIYHKVVTAYLDSDRIKRLNETREAMENVRTLISYKSVEYKKVETALERLIELYESEQINSDTFKKRSNTHNESLKRIKSEINALENEISATSETSTEQELSEKIQSFVIMWESATTINEKNLLLRSIVKKVYYTREDNNVTFEIEYH